MGQRRRTLAEVAASGDRAATLASLRDVVAATLLEADVGQVAALAKQLRDTLAELDSLPAAGKRSTSDDLAAKRTARRAGAASGTAPAVGDVERG